MPTSFRDLARSFSCLTVVALGACAPCPAVQAGGMAQQGLLATGTGEAKAAPDIARTTIGVEMRAESSEQATAQVTERMTAVIEAIKAAGVAAEDLRTQNYSVNFEQEPVPPTPQPDTGKAVSVRGHYRASNMVEVTIRDLSKVGAILARATEAGANNVWGISFELEHPETLMTQARAKAMENARQTAAELARLAGVTLGALVSVNESGGGMPMPMMKNMAEMAQQDAPIERGQITTTVQVQLVYALPE